MEEGLFLLVCLALLFVGIVVFGFYKLRKRRQAAAPVAEQKQPDPHKNAPVTQGSRTGPDVRTAPDLRVFQTSEGYCVFECNDNGNPIKKVPDFQMTTIFQPPAPAQKSA